MVKLRMKGLCVIILTLMLPVAAPAGLPLAQKHEPSAASPFAFAVIPFYSPEKIWSLYNPFIEYLRKITGDPWELQLFDNHAEFIDGLCSGRITVGFAGPAPLVKANTKCGAKPFLVALGKDGTPFYRSVILSNNPSVNNLAHLKRKKIGFFKGSTAAHIVPMKMLNDAGLKSEITPVFLSSQDAIIQQLLSGDIDAAGVKETLAKKFSGKPLKVIAVSDPLPNFALCASPSAPAPVLERLRSALTRLHPLKNDVDAHTVSGWDEELRQGVTPAGKGYLPSLLKFDRTFGGVR